MRALHPFHSGQLAPQARALHLSPSGQQGWKKKRERKNYENYKKLKKIKKVCKNCSRQRRSCHVRCPAPQAKALHSSPSGQQVEEERNQNKKKIMKIIRN